MTHDEIEELLGAYALDAIDDDERREVDDHLLTCPRCRAELAAHREVAALLGNSVSDAPVPAPDELWDRISASLQDEPPALSSFHRPLRRRLALLVPLGALAAALIVVVGLLAAKVGNLDQRVHNLGVQASVSSVLSNPSHETVELTSATHPAWQATVILVHGAGYLINPSMPRLGPSQTFQLWALSRGKVVSLGVLGSHPSAAPIRVEAPMTALMITAEPLGGTPTPTTPVLVRGNLSV
ncbi:MAG: anti-sigma factor [Acidimicrobiales bacterium]